MIASTNHYPTHQNQSIAFRGRLAFASTVLILASPCLADIVPLQITLDGFQENPSIETVASGMGTATIDTDTNEFSWNFEFQDMEGTPTAAHFHGAPVCQNGGAIIALPFVSPVVGSQVVSPAQTADILAGNWYVNVHSTLHPGGEIRGQVEPTFIANPIPTPIPLGDRIGLTSIADNMVAPNWATSAPGIAGRLFVVDQAGTVWNVDLASGNTSAFLDVSSLLVPLGIFGEDTFDERGLLGLAFHPEYANNGLLYTYTSEPFDNSFVADFPLNVPGFTPNHRAVITEWQAINPADPDTTADAGSARVLMTIDEPQFNHDGGAVTFGPDGMLYIAFGDGGNADDQEAGLDPFGELNLGHGCDGNGGDLGTILGSVIRIDPDGNNSTNGQYGIPADNPFVGENAVEETYAFGLRNPFRMSFDQATGDLYVADVGQNHIEEISVVQSGDDLGWNTMEGSFRFVRNGASAGYAVSASDIDVAGLTMPIAEYDHDEGIAIIGGFVHRGSNVPSLNGRYIFGDFAQTFSNDGRLFYLNDANAIEEFDVAGGFNYSLLGFGQDADGTMYALVNQTGVPFGTTGEVLRIDPPLHLQKAGSCPGQITVQVSQATPGSRIAILRANGTGNRVIPNNIACGGTILNLNNSVALATIVTANANGKATLKANVPGGACGNIFVQCVELDGSNNCPTSNVIIVE